MTGRDDIKLNPGPQVQIGGSWPGPTGSLGGGEAMWELTASGGLCVCQSGLTVKMAGHEAIKS